jgi:predicted DNA repair protein MutK
MAGSSLLALLDDIATVLDDVAILSKVAAKKTAGVLGDDLALNAEQVADIRAERELPVIWAVAKGSFKNKLILVPAALIISAIAPWLITPLLMIGGAYLCFEGFEKVFHYFSHSQAETKQEHKAMIEEISKPEVDLLKYEKGKIKGAIRTDFILSAEIIVIALGTVKTEPFMNQVLVVSLIALVITVGVYGLVAGIVKLDDAGFYLIKDKAKSFVGTVKRGLGNMLLAFAPLLMKSLTIIGTIAMFLVGGNILMHGFHYVVEKVAHLTQLASQVPTIGGVLQAITPTISEMIFGMLAGGILMFIMSIWHKFFPAKQAN